MTVGAPRIKTILVVDDDGMQRKAICRLLQLEFGKEFNVVGAENLTAALDILMEENREICGIITDNGFPLTNQKILRKGSDQSIEGAAGMILVRAAVSGNTGVADEIEFSKTVLPKEGAGEKRLKEILGDKKYQELLAAALKDPDLKDQISANPSLLYKLYINSLIAVQKFDVGSKATERKKELQNVPILWNTGDVERGKILKLERAARGGLIPIGAEFNDVSYMPGADSIHSIEGTNIAWTGKPIKINDVVTFFKNQIAKLTPVSAPTPRPDAPPPAAPFPS